jgi:hypothetical protein
MYALYGNASAGHNMKIGLMQEKEQVNLGPKPKHRAQKIKPF